MSDRMSSGKSDCRIYVGNLPPDVRSKDLEDIFHKFGKIVWVDLKNSKGPPFAFVEFEDPRDAEDAIRSRDGYDFDGYRLRVEFPRGAGGGGGRGGGGGYRGGGGGDRDGGYDRGGRGGNNYVRGGGRSGPPSKRTNFRVLISGLPATGSWQDLKDHMREAGDVCYSDVFKDGTGVVEFMRYDDMKYAIKKLDDSKFRSHEGETSYIRVKEDSGGNGHRSSSRTSHSRGRSRSRSRSPVKGRPRASPTYSPARRSDSRSNSRSRSRSNSRSRSRSRS